MFAALNSCHTSLFTFFFCCFRRREGKKIFQTLSDREFIVWCMPCTRVLHCIDISIESSHFEWIPCAIESWKVETVDNHQQTDDKSEEKWNFIVFFVSLLRISLFCNSRKCEILAQMKVNKFLKDIFCVKPSSSCYGMNFHILKWRGRMAKLSFRLSLPRIIETRDILNLLEKRKQQTISCCLTNKFL